tara:strand:- start:1399 stop:1683 length:285 start_codon:yes stop_codon:yes gene_type:complete
MDVDPRNELKNQIQANRIEIDELKKKAKVLLESQKLQKNGEKELKNGFYDKITKEQVKTKSLLLKHKEVAKKLQSQINNTVAESRSIHVKFMAA